MRFLPAFLLLLACASPDPEATASDSSDVASEVSAAQPERSATYDLRPATAREILDYVEAQDGKVRVVNFWATWCVPCIAEFPHFVRLERELAGRGVDVVFVSADFYPDEQLEADVRAFLAQQGVDGVTFIKNEKDDPFITAFAAEWTGSLPATIVYGPDGTKAAFWEGATDYESLHDVVTTALDASTDRT